MAGVGGAGRSGGTGRSSGETRGASESGHASAASKAAAPAKKAAPSEQSLPDKSMTSEARQRLKDAFTPEGGWVQEGQRQRALAVARGSPAGSVGAAIAGPLEAATSRVRDLCAGDIGDYYESRREALALPATRANIEAFTGPETAHFQEQPGCAKTVGGWMSAKDRADTVEASAQGQGVGRMGSKIIGNKLQSGWDSLTRSVGGLFPDGSSK